MSCLTNSCAVWVTVNIWWTFSLTYPYASLKWLKMSYTKFKKKVLYALFCTFSNKGNAKRGVSPRLTIWPWKTIGFQILLRTMYVPCLVKIHWKMLILECSHGCYAVKMWPLDLWPWKSIGFQTLIRTKYVPSLVKIHWMMLILVFTR